MCENEGEKQERGEDKTSIAVGAGAWMVKGKKGGTEGRRGGRKKGRKEEEGRDATLLGSCPSLFLIMQSAPGRASHEARQHQTLRSIDCEEHL